MSASKRAPTDAANGRPIALRVRAGLVRRAHGAGTIVTDPATGASHQLSEVEACVLGWLDGSASPIAWRSPSLQELCKRHDQRFAPRRIEPAAMQRLLGRLHDAELIEAPGAHAAAGRWRRACEQRARSRRLAWTRLLAIRLPLGSPDALLRPLDGLARVLFSGPSAIGAVALCCLAVVAILGDIDRFVAEAPRLAWLTQPRLLVGMLLVLAALKTLHEFGHALAARRFGVNVREVGVMLLFFMPCLYCDVSDAWRLSSQRARMLIAAAGVLAEVAIAAAAALVWRTAEPGVVSMIAMNTVAIATIGTLLVNLNPLVRFDGYYLLSDWLETPNLASRGRAALMSRLTAPLLRDARQENDAPTGFAFYGLLSMGYTLAITGGFLWLVMGVGRAWRVEGLALILVAGIVASVFAAPVMSLLRTLERPDRIARLRTGRATIGVLLAAAAVVALALTPWPHRPLVQATVVPNSGAGIAVVRPGRLVSIAQPGDRVAAGDPIAVLEDPQASLALLRAEQAVERRRLAVRALEARQAVDPAVAAQLAAARAAVAAAERLLEEGRAESERLTLRARRAGVVVPPVRTTSDDFSRTPDGLTDRITEKDRGRWLTVGTPLARVIDPADFELRLMAPAHVAERLAPGQAVRVSLAGDARIGDATITRLAARYDRPTDSRGAFNDAYERVATARFDNATPSPPLIDTSGVARIDLGYLPIGRQLFEAAARLFTLPP